MHDADGREPVPGNPDHTLPGNVSLLATSAKPAFPETHDLMAEGMESVGVQGHAVVLDVPTDD